jgi:hypothetical protein
MLRGRETFAVIHGRFGDLASHLPAGDGPDAVARLFQTFVRSAAIGKRGGARG